MTWQPIETAPRDGSEILLWDKEFEACAVGYFFEPFAQWVAFPGCTEEVNPTHWMPLPQPPEEEQ